MTPEEIERRGLCPFCYDTTKIETSLNLDGECDECGYGLYPVFDGWEEQVSFDERV